MEAAPDQATSAPWKTQKTLRDVLLALGRAKSCAQAVFAQGRRLHMSMILGLTPFSNSVFCIFVCRYTISLDKHPRDEAELGSTWIDFDT